MAIGAAMIGLLATGLVELGRGDLPPPASIFRPGREGSALAATSPAAGDRPRWMLAESASAFDSRRGVLVLADGTTRVLPRTRSLVLVTREGRVLTLARGAEREAWLELAASFGAREPIERAFALAR